MTNLDREIERIETEDAWDDSDEVVELDAKEPIDKVVSIRLSAEKWNELRKEAGELGVGPTTLARMWILERLRERSRAGA